MKSYRNIGISLLLVVFLVLCLTIFATLSLSTSQGDYNLTLNQANRDRDYYAASNAAEEQLAIIDDVLESIREEMLVASNDTAESYQDSTSKTLDKNQESSISAEFLAEQMNNSSNIDMTVTNNGGIFHIDYSVRINDNQALYVGLNITDAITNPTATGEHFYEIDAWQVKNDKQ